MKLLYSTSSNFYIPCSPVVLHDADDIAIVVVDDVCLVTGLECWTGKSVGNNGNGCDCISPGLTCKKRN